MKRIGHDNLKFPAWFLRVQKGVISIVVESISVLIVLEQLSWWQEHFLSELTLTRHNQPPYESDIYYSYNAMHVLNMFPTV